MFQDFKTQGFHLENTHLKAPYNNVKLLYLVSVTYCFRVHLGLWQEKEQGSMAKKNHGYRAKSVFRVGLDLFRAILNKKNEQALELWHTLVDKFIHLMLIKTIKINKL